MPQWVSKVLDLRNLAALPNLSELSRLEGQELLRPTVMLFRGEKVGAGVCNNFTGWKQGGKDADDCIFSSCHFYSLLD